MLLARSLYFSSVFALSGFASPIGLHALSETLQARGDETAFAAAAPIKGGRVDATIGDPLSPQFPNSKWDRHFKRAADGLFYVDMRVNDTPVRFVVDTGSSVMVLTRRDAARLGIRPDADEYDATVRTAAGDSAMAWTTLHRVRLGSRRVDNVRAVVVRDGLSVSLLGQNMLGRLGRMTIDGNRLTLG